MKSKPGRKKKYAPVDADMALMEKLDKGPPTAYTAWKPDDAPPADSGGADGGAGLTSAAASLSAAAASLDDDSFLQIASSDTQGDEIAWMNQNQNAEERFKLLSSETAAAAARATSPGFDDAASQLIMETVTQEADEPDAAAASTVLAAYADVMNSKPLHQLSETRLNREKLTALFNRMQGVDNNVGDSAGVVSAAGGQESDAEQWCLRFHREGQSSSPVMAARSKMEAADTEMAEAAARRDAVKQERDAHEQLLKTAKMDSKGLSALLQTVQQTFDPVTLAISEWQERAAALGLNVGGESLMLFQAASAAREALSSARMELTSAIASATLKRTKTEERQHLLMSQVAVELADAERAWNDKVEVDRQAKAALDSSANSFTGVEAMCDQALEAANNKKHAMAREVSAVGMALAVLGGK